MFNHACTYLSVYTVTFSSVTRHTPSTNSQLSQEQTAAKEWFTARRRFEKTFESVVPRRGTRTGREKSRRAKARVGKYTRGRSFPRFGATATARDCSRKLQFTDRPRENCCARADRYRAIAQAATTCSRPSLLSPISYLLNLSCC